MGERLTLESTTGHLLDCITVQESKDKAGDLFTYSLTTIETILRKLWPTA